MSLLKIKNCLTFFCLVFFNLTSWSQTEKKLQIAVYVSDNYSRPLAQAIDLLNEQPEFKEKVQILTTGNQTRKGNISQPDVALCYIHTPAIIQRYKSQLEKIMMNEGAVYALGSSLQREEYEEMGIKFDSHIASYFEHPSPENLVQMIKVVANRHVDLELPIRAVYEYPNYGLVNWKNNSFHQSFEDYKASFHEQWIEGAPVVGLYSFRYEFVSNQYEHIKTYADTLNANGYNVLICYGSPLEQVLHELVLSSDSNSKINVLLNFSALPGASPDKLEKTFRTVGVPVINAICLHSSYSEWQSNRTGISILDRTMSLARPELSGQIQPTIAFTSEKYRLENGEEFVIKTPIPERIARLTGRVKSWINLQHKPNSDKKIALIYYNGHPGKDNIGASYLNVLPHSIQNILQALQDESYTLGKSSLDADSIYDNVMREGRNLGTWASGEMNRLVRENNPVLIPVATYKKWFEKMTPSFQAEVKQKWGGPEQANIMTWKDKNDQLFIVLPRVQYGHIQLMPQPTRGWGEDEEALFHDVSLPPHHQYIAFYLYLQHEFQADALINLGTHGTHEWLSGREAGLDDEDAPEALMGNMINIYPYIMDNVGEGTQAKRRGMAIIIDHLTPPFDRSEWRPEWRDLAAEINDYNRLAEKTPVAAKSQLNIINNLLEGTSLRNAWGTDSIVTEDNIHELEHYLQEINEQITPLGMHTFGRSPDSLATWKTAEAIVSRQKGLTDSSRMEHLQEIFHRISISGKEELNALLQALNGRYIPAGTGNDPIRNPDALPTGRNFYAFDPSRIPAKAIYEMGAKLADELVSNYKKKHGTFPDKVALSLWSVETIRHEGVMESQILSLMGVKPKYDGYGKVTGVELIPRDSLGRPRVDVIITPSGLYRDMFSNMMMMIDRAINLAISADEADNHIRKHVIETKNWLIKHEKIDTVLADRLAKVRLFGTQTGTYGTGLDNVIQASDQWDQDKQVVDVYFNRMGHLYGQGFWGDVPNNGTAKDLALSVFKNQLSGTKAVLHSRSSNVYGVLDNDDVFQYLGGLAMAVKSTSGTAPDIIITNLSDPNEAKQESLQRFMNREMETRYLNPKWINAMMDEGYAGARMIGKVTDNIWGWQVTTPESIDDHLWQEWHDVYVADKYGMNIKERFSDAKNLYAYQGMLARMIEVIRKEYWTPDEETAKEIVQRYLETASESGLSCADMVCGNDKLVDYIKDRWNNDPNVSFDNLIQHLGNIRQSVQSNNSSNSKSANPESSAQTSASSSPTHQISEKQQNLANQKTLNDGGAEIKGFKMEEVTFQNSFQTDIISNKVLADQRYLALVLSILFSGFVYAGYRKERA